MCEDDGRRLRSTVAFGQFCRIIGKNVYDCRFQHDHRSPVLHRKRYASIGRLPAATEQEASERWGDYTGTGALVQVSGGFVFL